MFRCIHEADAMADVTQELGACRHRLQEPPFLLFAELLLDATGFGDESHQGFGLMNVQLINDKKPRGLWINGNRVGDRPRKVFFCPAWSHCGRHDFPRGAVEVGDQTLCPVAPIFLLRTLDHAWLHGQGRGSTLQRLAPRFLIRTDDMPPLLGDGWRVLVDFTHRRPLGGNRDGVIRLGVEPIFHPVRR
jgi:hypothetical protein